MLTSQVPTHTKSVLILGCCTPFSLVLQYWGGGAFCADNYKHLPTVYSNCTIPSVSGTSFITASCYNADIRPMCTNNGDVKLPFGSAPYVGMGLMVSEVLGAHGTRVTLHDPVLLHHQYPVVSCI